MHRASIRRRSVCGAHPLVELEQRRREGARAPGQGGGGRVGGELACPRGAEHRQPREPADDERGRDAEQREEPQHHGGDGRQVRDVQGPARKPRRDEPGEGEHDAAGRRADLHDRGVPPGEMGELVREDGLELTRVEQLEQTPRHVDAAAGRPGVRRPGLDHQLRHGHVRPHAQPRQQLRGRRMRAPVARLARRRHDRGTDADQQHAGEREPRPLDRRQHGHRRCERQDERDRHREQAEPARRADAHRHAADGGRQRRRRPRPVQPHAPRRRAHHERDEPGRSHHPPEVAGVPGDRGGTGSREDQHQRGEQEIRFESREPVKSVHRPKG